MADHTSVYSGFNEDQVGNSIIGAFEYLGIPSKLVATTIAKGFTYGKGDTITVKSPTTIDAAKTYTPEQRAAGETSVLSDLARTKVGLTFGPEIYNAVALPHDVETFQIEDLENEVIKPLAQTIIEAVDGKVIEAYAGFSDKLTAADKAAKGKIVGVDGQTYDTVAEVLEAGTEVAATGVKTTVKDAGLVAATHADVQKVIRNAKRLLDERRVPTTGRVLVVDPLWAQALASQPNIVRVNESGSSDALREATIGRISGFDVVEVRDLPEYTAVAYHPDGLALGLATPKPQQGYPFCVTKTAGNYTVRYVHQSDQARRQDVADMSIFAVAQVVAPQYGVTLKGTEGFEEPAVAESTEPAA